MVFILVNCAVENLCLNCGVKKGLKILKYFIRKFKVKG